MENWKWSCDVCKKSGSVEVDESDGVMETIYKIKDAHKEESAACDWNSQAIRVEKV